MVLKADYFVILNLPTLDYPDLIFGPFLLTEQYTISQENNQPTHPS